MSIFLMHFEMIGSGEHAGIARDALFIDVEASRDIVLKFIRLVGHVVKLKENRLDVILSFRSKTVTPLDL